VAVKCGVVQRLPAVLHEPTHCRRAGAAGGGSTSAPRRQRKCGGAGPR
jgi:hypothetical protein